MLSQSRSVKINGYSKQTKSVFNEWVATAQRKQAIIQQSVIILEEAVKIYIFQFICLFHHVCELQVSQLLIESRFAFRAQPVTKKKCDPMTEKCNLMNIFRFQLRSVIQISVVNNKIELTWRKRPQTAVHTLKAVKESLIIAVCHRTDKLS